MTVSAPMLYVVVSVLGLGVIVLKVAAFLWLVSHGVTLLH